jgi:hypothetical protein
LEGLKMPKGKRYANTVNRRKPQAGLGAANRIGSRTPIIPTPGTPASTSQTITFNQPVSLKGVPAVFDTSTPTVTVNSATQPAANQVVLVFNSAPTAAISWPFEDPAIRNRVGGYVPAGSYTFS